MSKTLEIIAELALILRDKHPGWDGDCRANGATFLRRVSRDDPSLAAAIAGECEIDAMRIADSTGLSPNTVGLLIPRVLRGIDPCL